MSENNDKSSDQKTKVSDEDCSSIDPSEKWLIRDCDVYKDEYDECTSFKGRFHQYFIYGESLDCNQWKKDYTNCRKWVDNNDVKAGKAVIQSETARRLERLRPHYQNNVWKKRESPPADWDKPLPEWLQKRDENSYLALKAKEMKEGKEEATSSCCIM
ncbi:UPF0545 protein C22orf39 homolog [Danaus plexippus]|uniref:Synaptic plasticity regulator PANTS n=1 Tax=Danaus plexippus plexippus TaxID=278856 RepID=A0A212EY64_DANPL|nr:UPF0545 protein C22orf39 homolog [Danaus plexippus]OWR46436.1 hypothetical protein KGM_212104 [Danaus plexippus plexippus]